MKVELLRPYFRYAGFVAFQFAEDHFRVTKEMVFELRQLNYVEQWKLSHAHRWFHVVLEDLAYFTFSEVDGKSSYGYYPCPLDVQSLSDYLRERDIELTQKNRLAAAEKYELSVQTANLRESITPIRYDLDTGAYRTCTHPATHIHIGLDNQIRIATRRLMTPLAFVLFIFRQVYPDNWHNLLQYSTELGLARRIRGDLSEVGAEHWTADDELQSYLY